MIRWLITFAMCLAGLGWLALLAAVRLGEVQRRWPVELLDTFALYAFVPFLLLLLVAMLVRSRLLLIPVVGATLLFWQQFGHQLAPTPALAVSDQPMLRVLSYNVLWTNRDAGPLATLVDAERPDVIVLQELTSGYAEDLRRRLGAEYRYSALAEVGAEAGGSGVFSRLPIADSRQTRLSPNGHVVQHVRLAIGGTTLSLFNVHLDSPDLHVTNPPGPVPPLLRGFGSPVREIELERLVAETARLRGPFILAGDFNLSAGSRPYRQFPVEWQDTFGERGWGFGHTFPTSRTMWGGRLSVSFPLVRIDYVLSSPGLAPTRAWVPELAGSDHLPVIADLQLTTSR